MISRSSRCTAASAIDAGAAAQRQMVGRRARNAERRRRRQLGVATRTAPDAGEWLAQAAVGLGDQERQAEHARPRLPFGDDVGAVVAR